MSTAARCRGSAAYSSPARQSDSVKRSSMTFQNVIVYYTYGFCLLELPFRTTSTPPRPAAAINEDELPRSRPTTVDMGDSKGIWSKTKRAYHPFVSRGICVRLDLVSQGSSHHHGADYQITVLAV